MEFDAFDAWFIGSWVLSYLIGLVAHEIGHAAAASAVGFHPRLISIGIGRAVLRWRFGQAWFVLRLLPVVGHMTYLPHLPTRRLRKAAVTAGGPLANGLLLAIAGAIYLADPAAFGIGHLVVTDEKSFAIFMAHLTAQVSLDAFSMTQVFLLVTTLIPARGKAAGRSISSDGWKLWRLAVDPAGATDGGLLAAYAALMQNVLPPGAPLPSPSPYGAEIVFQAIRRDRQREAWADRDAAEVMQRLLQQEALPDLERAYVLRFLVGHELTRAKTGADLARLDQWSRQAVVLAPTRDHQVLRAGVLRAMGRIRDADAIHWALAYHGSTASTVPLEEPSAPDGSPSPSPAAGSPRGWRATSGPEAAIEQGLFRVVIVNDDSTPMDFVIQALIEIFQKTEDDAVRIVLMVHCTGRGTCGVYGRTDAESLVDRMTVKASHGGHPLRCLIEPDSLEDPLGSALPLGQASNGAS